MRIYEERNIFVNREQKEDSINDANLEMTENFPQDADNRFFQDIKPEKFSNIFLHQNLELSNHDHIFLYSVKQNFKSDSKEVISDNAFSEILNTVPNFIIQESMIIYLKKF